MAHYPIVTVDGPSGSGKGTICKLLAEHKGWHLLDSGALYRVLGLAANHHGVDLGDDQALAILAAHLDVQFAPQAAGVRVILEGEDVTDEIRTEKSGAAASIVAAIPAVRTALLDRQRAFADQPGLVADGRDMGTVVFPQAAVKIFLTASAEERAQRRYNQLIQKDVGASLQEVLEDIQRRDDRDMNRSVAPLRPAEDALVIDSTSVSIEQVYQQVLEAVETTFNI